jgi:peptidoglycan/LPS O-acetylase OafA/YrhL
VSFGLFFIAIENRFFNNSNRYIFFSILEVLAVLSACTSIYCSRYFPFTSLLWSVYSIPFSVILILIFAFQKGIISSILSQKMFAHLGNLSFSIYMIHQLAIYYTQFYFLSPISGMAFELKHFISQLLLLFVIICLADVINRYFVEPQKKRIIALSLIRYSQCN